MEIIMVYFSSPTKKPTQFEWAGFRKLVFTGQANATLPNGAKVAPIPVAKAERVGVTCTDHRVDNVS